MESLPTYADRPGANKFWWIVLSWFARCQTATMGCKITGGLWLNSSGMVIMTQRCAYLASYVACNIGFCSFAGQLDLWWQLFGSRRSGSSMLRMWRWSPTIASATFKPRGATLSTSLTTWVQSCIAGFRRNLQPTWGVRFLHRHQGRGSLQRLPPDGNLPGPPAPCRGDDSRHLVTGPGLQPSSFWDMLSKLQDLPNLPW